MYKCYLFMKRKLCYFFPLLSKYALRSQLSLAWMKEHIIVFWIILAYLMIVGVAYPILFIVPWSVRFWRWSEAYRRSGGCRLRSTGRVSPFLFLSYLFHIIRNIILRLGSTATSTQSLHATCNIATNRKSLQCFQCLATVSAMQWTTTTTTPWWSTLCYKT